MQQFGSLAGLHEIHNSSNGYLHAATVLKLVGDKEKAQAVLVAGESELALAESAPPDYGQGQARSLAHVLQIATQGQ